MWFCTKYLVLCVGNIFKSKGLISNILDDIWDNNKQNRFRYETPMECKECKIESLCHNFAC